jgi:hypothetical protein
VELICKALAADPNLAGGINVLGTSQGGILMRGYLERCNNPPVKNFISWVAPMMGVYGCPVVGIPSAAAPSLAATLTLLHLKLMSVFVFRSEAGSTSTLRWMTSPTAASTSRGHRTSSPSPATGVVRAPRSSFFIPQLRFRSQLT